MRCIRSRPKRIPKAIECRKRRRLGLRGGATCARGCRSRSPQTRPEPLGLRAHRLSSSGAARAAAARVRAAGGPSPRIPRWRACPRPGRSPGAEASALARDGARRAARLTALEHLQLPRDRDARPPGSRGGAARSKRAIRRPPPRTGRRSRSASRRAGTTVRGGSPTSLRQARSACDVAVMRRPTCASASGSSNGLLGGSGTPRRRAAPRPRPWLHSSSVTKGITGCASCERASQHVQQRGVGPPCARPRGAGGA